MGRMTFHLFIIAGTNSDLDCLIVGFIVMSTLVFAALYCAFRYGYRRGRDSVLKDGGGGRGFPVITHVKPVIPLEDEKKRD